MKEGKHETDLRGIEMFICVSRYVALWKEVRVRYNRTERKFTGGNSIRSRRENIIYIVSYVIDI